MIMIERDFIARWVKELKKKQNSENRDYYTGYISAMSTVEGMLALVPEYDTDRLSEMPQHQRPGLFTPGEVQTAMSLHGQGNPRFKVMEKIRYSPSEVAKILKGDLPKWTEKAATEAHDGVIDDTLGY